jgi:hypothetical protein
MSSAAEFSADHVWLWDLYPLADDAWPSVSLSRKEWSDWIVEPGETMTLRRWVTGPNGPSFLTEYTPADDYITEGYRGRHDTFNGLYRDTDREFYMPRPEDLHLLRQFDAQVRPETPSWTSIRVALCQAGHQDIDLAKAKAPVLIGYLCEIVNADESDKANLGMQDSDGHSPAGKSEQQPASPTSDAQLNTIEEMLRRLCAGALLQVGHTDLTPTQVRERFDALPPSRRKAWMEYYEAEELLGACTDKQAYEFINERLEKGATLPSFETWRRYVRDARNALGLQKYSPGKGKPTGKSVISPDDVDPGYYSNQ